MFDARKAHKLSKKAYENKVNLWERLQLEIRNKAMSGSNILEIDDNNKYMLLRTTLEVFGYEVRYNNDINKWEICW